MAKVAKKKKERSIPSKSKLAEALLVTNGIARCLRLAKRFFPDVAKNY